MSKLLSQKQDSRRPWWNPRFGIWAPVVVGTIIVLALPLEPGGEGGRAISILRLFGLAIAWEVLYLLILIAIGRLGFSRIRNQSALNCLLRLIIVVMACLAVTILMLYPFP